jgi:hypothetical protein
LSALFGVRNMDFRQQVCSDFVFGDWTLPHMYVPGDFPTTTVWGVILFYRLQSPDSGLRTSEDSWTLESPTGEWRLSRIKTQEFKRGKERTAAGMLRSLRNVTFVTPSAVADAEDDDDGFDTPFYLPQVVASFYPHPIFSKRQFQATSSLYDDV